MAKHEFGMMGRAPILGERYDRYEPEKYVLTAIEDAALEPLMPRLDEIVFFWHSLDVPGKGLAYCGITLIPPGSMGAVIEIIEGYPGLDSLKHLLLEAQAKNKFVIHYGL